MAARLGRVVYQMSYVAFRALGEADPDESDGIGAAFEPLPAEAAKLVDGVRRNAPAFHERTDRIAALLDSYVTLTGEMCAMVRKGMSAQALNPRPQAGGSPPEDAVCRTRYLRRRSGRGDPDGIRDAGRGDADHPVLGDRPVGGRHRGEHPGRPAGGEFRRHAPPRPADGRPERDGAGGPRHGGSGGAAWGRDRRHRQGRGGHQGACSRHSGRAGRKQAVDGRGGRRRAQPDPAGARRRL